ncbi:DUF2484 family protein [Rhodobacterales bacterium HKCCE3408]|nr:DUF2484 family protein [Rhodobacterales bacterium HKCCE3408]
MSLSLILACLWVLAAAITAFLPYRMQFPPGIALLVLSLPLAVFVGVQNGWLWGAAMIFAIASMFRNPLIYFARRAMRRGEET